jgi:hypothetical protein
MTIVASFSLQSYPVLLGDLMISRWFENRPNVSPFHVLTLRDVNSEIPTEWGWIVTELRQKVVLLGDKLALGWAGSQLAASWAVREIQSQMTDGTVSLNRIVATLEGLDLGQLDLTIVGLLVETINPGTHVAMRFAWDSHRGGLEPVAVFPATGPIYADGSGRDDLVRALQQVGGHMSPSRATTGIEAAILGSMSVTNILAGQQMRLGAGLASLYGGGFEFATVVDGNIMKIGDLTHFFMDAVRLENGDTKVHLRRAITYEYQGDVLLVGTLELQMEWLFQSLEGQATLTYSAEIQGEPAVYAIFPVHRSPDEEERLWLLNNPPVLHFRSRFTALYIHLPQRGGLVKSLVHYAGAHEPALGMTLDGNGADVVISYELLAKISAMLA